MKRIIIAAGVVMAVLAVAVPAGATTTTVTANINSSLSLDTTSLTSAVSDWSLASTGANTISGGSGTVTANVPYTLNVAADKAKMSEYNTATPGYVSSGKTLASALSVVGSRSGGTAATPGVATTAVSGVSTLLATGTGLGTDIYGLTISQPTVIADSRLGADRTYRMVLTYSVTSTLV